MQTVSRHGVGRSTVPVAKRPQDSEYPPASVLNANTIKQQCKPMSAARLSKDYFSKKNLEYQTFSEFLKASSPLQSLHAKTPEEDLEDDGGGVSRSGGGR